MGDVTEEQRKAVVEKFAAMWFGLDHAHATPATLPRTWARLCNEYRRNAQAALEAVGYFKLVEVAEAVADSWAGFDHDCCLVDMKLLSVLQTLLKEAV